MRIRNTIPPEIVDTRLTLSMAQMKRLVGLNKDRGYWQANITIRQISPLQEVENGIHVILCLEDNNCYIQLSYQADGQEVCDKIPLVKVRNNLGDAFAPNWYFYFPQTGKLAKKLYLNKHRFTHRTEIKNGIYFLQTLAKGSRGELQLMRKISTNEKIISDLSKKNFRRYYRTGISKRQAKVTRAKAELDRLRSVYN